MRAILRNQAEISRSKQYQAQEITNIIEASNQLANQLIDGKSETRISPAAICDFNKLVLWDLPLEEDVVPGQIRRYSVGVADYRAAPAEDCEYLLQRLCDWINGIHAPSADNQIAFAVIKAVLAHLYIAWIHPFGDGNGRTARLVEVQILLGSGVPMVAAHLLSNHYNETRAEYYRQLSHASKSGGDVRPFIRYAAQGLFDGLNQQIARIRRSQRSLTWRDYVWKLFRNDESKAAIRQRNVALALPIQKGVGVSRAKIRIINAEIAALYAGKTEKTVTRDLNQLIQKNLIVKTTSGIRARVEVLESFLPRRRKASASATLSPPSKENRPSDQA